MAQFYDTVIDGDLLIKSGGGYINVDTELSNRVKYSDSIDTLEKLLANTSSDKIAGALAVKESYNTLTTNMNTKLDKKLNSTNVINSLDDVVANTSSGMAAGALALKELSTNINRIRFYPFTKVIKASGSSVQLYTLDQLKTIFGSANIHNTGAFVMNGDGSACGVHIDGVTWKSSILYAVFNTSFSGTVRITGALYNVAEDNLNKVL